MQSTATRLVLSLLVGLFCCASAVRGSLTDSLVGYWPVDGNGQDASGAGRDVTLYGNLGFTGGLFGQALNFMRNNNQYAQRPVSDAAFNFGASDFTIQAWVNYNATARPEQTLLEKFTGIRGAGWSLTSFLGGIESELHFIADNGNLLIYDTNYDLSLNAWHHVLVRRNGTVVSIFQDGAAVASGSFPATDQSIDDSSLPLLIGERNSSGQVFPLDAKLDELAIWRRALSNEEIAYLYNGGQGHPVPEPSTAVLAIVACGMMWCWRKRFR